MTHTLCSIEEPDVQKKKKKRKKVGGNFEFSYLKTKLSFQTKEVKVYHIITKWFFTEDHLSNFCDIQIKYSLIQPNTEEQKK